MLRRMAGKHGARSEVRVAPRTEHPQENGTSKDKFSLSDLNIDAKILSGDIARKMSNS